MAANALRMAAQPIPSERKPVLPPQPGASIMSPQTPIPVPMPVQVPLPARSQYDDDAELTQGTKFNVVCRFEAHNRVCAKRVLFLRPPRVTLRLSRSQLNARRSGRCSSSPRIARRGAGPSQHSAPPLSDAACRRGRNGKRSAPDLQYSKARHAASEKKRREELNVLFDHIKQKVPSSANAEESNRLTKLDILSQTEDYIKRLEVRRTSTHAHAHSHASHIQTHGADGAQNLAYGLLQENRSMKAAMFGGPRPSKEQLW